jgi:hypothetical protein
MLFYPTRGDTAKRPPRGSGRGASNLLRSFGCDRLLRAATEEAPERGDERDQPHHDEFLEREDPDPEQLEESGLRSGGARDEAGDAVGGGLVLSRQIVGVDSKVRE